MTTELTWRVVLVGDDALARGGLGALCARAGLAVLAEVASSEAARIADREAPDALIWDVGEVSKSINRLRAITSVPIIALIEGADDAAEVLAAGARGAFFREVEGAQLEAAVRAVARRSIVLDEGLSSLLRRASRSSASAEALTTRETEVLQLLSLGVSNKEIANRLGISEHTAKFHVNAILGKLGAESRTEAVVLAARLGLLIL